MIRAQRRNITFYPVSAEGLETFDDSLSQRSRANGLDSGLTGGPLTQSIDRLRDRTTRLRELAMNTNGIAVVDTNDLAGGLRRVVDDTSAYYLLGYYSPTTKLDGAYHRIDVKIKRPGTTVKARRIRAECCAEAAKAERPRPPPLPPGADALALAAVRRTARVVRSRMELVLVSRSRREDGGRQVSAGRRRRGASFVGVAGTRR